MTLADTIYAFYMPLYNNDSAVIEYYADIYEGINCLIWEATRAKGNLLAADWQTCRLLNGQLGSAPTLPGA
jgi:hypothetical protein